MYSDEKKMKNIEDSKEKIFKLYKNIDYHSINNNFKRKVKIDSNQ